jgi:3-phosphoshikimate 1-carboxyvinyltransferase
VQRFVVEPGQRIAGEISVPGDKSISHRALMLGAIADGRTEIHGFLNGDDCLATLAAMRALGVAVSVDSEGTVVVEGRGAAALKAPRAPLDLGNSGTALRLLTGLLAGTGTAAELTGDESLRSRPMERIAAPLRMMGAQIATQDGLAPIRLGAGPGLRGIDYAMPVASAQIKSAILLATLGARGETVIRSPGISRDHTERMLATMGFAPGVEDDGLTLRLTGPCRLQSAAIDVPGDISSAAFFLVAGALAADGEVLIRNVGVNSTRTGVITILQAMGADLELRNRRDYGAEPVADLAIRRCQLQGIEIPPALVPAAIDELPVIFIAAAAARGRTRVTGAAELRHKESDRIGVMARALTTAGVHVVEEPDGLVIDGGQLRGATVDSQGDHRVAMAFAVAALAASERMEILNTEQVATSFPGFATTAARVRFDIRVEQTAAA